DDVLERLNLARQLTGRGTVAAVLHLEHRPGGAELDELRSGAPSRAEADQDGQHQNRHDDGERRTQAECRPANNATRTVRDYYRVTTRAHWSPGKSECYRLAYKGDERDATAFGAVELYHTCIGRESANLRGRKSHESRGARMRRALLCADD